MNNTASASATNASSVNDPGDITCQTPVLAIAKTPDGGARKSTRLKSSNMSMSYDVLCSETEVAISDPLPAGGGVSWNTATAGCTVTGAVGSQSLGCTIGSLAQSATFTAVVTSATSLGHLHSFPTRRSSDLTNASSVNDPGDITCQTPVLQIAKTPDG